MDAMDVDGCMERTPFNCFLRFSTSLRNLDHSISKEMDDVTPIDLIQQKKASITQTNYDRQRSRAHLQG